ncbi:deaminase domain-containing protein [Pseudomonas koreensis]|uniref:deaminase domain-containing protein n=1 Tax=Pseudomonas koreensis TaxID=198620 RepID=UPI00380B182D
MPTLIRSAPTDIQDASPSATQIYQSELQDYELLLSFMRAEIGSISEFGQTLLKPRTFSPLDQENETGQEALQQLLKTTDYLKLCEEHKVSPHYLTVTFRDGAYVYETSNHDSEKKVILPISGLASLQVLTSRIEKSATLMGGEIRYDRLISLPRIATFYGFAPWDPTDTAAHKTAINTVEERIASYRLGLEDDFNILDLRRRPTEKDRKLIRTVLSASSDPSRLDRQKLQTQIIAREIVDAAIEFLPQSSTSLLTYLAQNVLPSATIEEVRATPTVYLQKILQGAEAEKLATILLSVMDWYGGKAGEETSPHIRTKVVANALQIWLKTPTSENPDGIAGFDFQSRSHWGKSYQAIWHEFETHLLSTKRASSEKEAVVIARLFLGQFPTEFGVRDISPDLPYRSSVVWVNFVNGVNLINATDPKALRRMTFQKLVNLPLQRAEAATEEQLSEISLARLPPTLDWAVTQGIIPHKKREDYTQLEIGLALTKLDNHTSALNDMITRLKEESPQRMSMAKTVAQKIFGKRYVEQDRKVARKLPESNRWNDLPLLPGKGYDYHSLIDVLASDEFDNETKWYYTLSDGSLSKSFFSINSKRYIKTTFYFSTDEWTPKANGILPDIKTEFYTSFQNHLAQQTTAYKTLISSLLVSLAFSDREAIESGELKIYSLRKQTSGVEANNETPEIILPLRARNGLILQTTCATETRTYELLPRAGVIRRIENLAAEQFGGAEKTERWRFNKSNSLVSVLRHKELPFDWDAHATGSTPKQGAFCQAIIEQLGDVFIAPPNKVATSNNVPLTLFSSRCMEICDFIATHFLFIDPRKLYTTAYGQTAFEKEQATKNKTLEIIKAFVPFWKSIEDLASGDKTRLINGLFGLFIDVASFALPVGKFASGSATLISNTGRLTLRARLPAFTSLTKELMILTLMAMNPVDGIGQFLKALGTRGLKLGRFGIFQARQLAGKAGHYDFARSLPQISDAGRWKPLVSGDQLATIRGIDDVLVRNIATAGKSNYRFIDPVSSRPYGPSLTTHSDGLSFGRSHYNTLENNHRHVVVELSENSRVREVLEVDGSTTLFIDNQPYRLKNGTLHRAELTENTYKAIPCRKARAPGSQLCETRYVLRDPAPTPDIGSIDDVKGWAPWFGDTLYTPATGRTAMHIDAMLKPSTLTATMEFQKGIYGRLMVSVPAEGDTLVDTVRTGATIVEAMDGSKQYIFMRLSSGNFYVAERANGQNVFDTLTFKKAETLPTELKSELIVVYTGSLHANNMVRIYGQSLVERALKAMDEIAISIGSHANPPETLRWLRVDTSPGEAALFDHSTRMIVRSSTDGAATWSLSKSAPDSVRETTAEIFNNLFDRKAVTVGSSSQTGPKALKIDDTMMQLQSLISKEKGRPVHTPRNIAFAEIKTKAGVREVYVSVSGQQGDTGFLPLFAKNSSKNEVKVGSTRYFNIDDGSRFPVTALSVKPEGKLQAIPHTIADIEKYKPALTSRPTSLDTESKLIAVIRGKYPDPKDLDSIIIATTMAPCDSCSVVMKQFAYEGNPNALTVIWK